MAKTKSNALNVLRNNKLTLNRIKEVCSHDLMMVF